MRYQLPKPKPKSKPKPKPTTPPSTPPPKGFNGVLAKPSGKNKKPMV